MRNRLRTHPVTLILLLASVRLLAVPGQLSAQDASADAEWSAEGRLHAYVRDLIGPGALVGTAVATAVDQMRDDPPEWGDGGEGLARRAASNLGRASVEQTVRHGLAVALGRSTRYQRCDCRGLGARVGHAVVETVTDRNRAGERGVSIPRFAGIVAAVLAQPLWRPDVSTDEVVVSVGSTVVFEAAGNAVKEILGWPR